MATIEYQPILAQIWGEPQPATHSTTVVYLDELKNRSDRDPLAAVVAACQRGDRTAKRQLYDDCHQAVFRLAVRMVGLQDAADVTQQVFLQAFRSISKFHGRSRFETWLYRLAVNEALQHLRRDRRRRHQPLEWEPADDAVHPETSERKELIEEALQRIDPQLRSIFLLREVDGASYQEINSSRPPGKRWTGRSISSACSG